MALLGKVHIDFPGIVVIYEDGCRDVPYCHQSDARWLSHWRWLGTGFGSNVRAAVAGK